MLDLIQQAQNAMVFRVYGTYVNEIKAASDANTESLGLGREKPQLIKVIALAMGITGSCRKVPPFYLLVAGEGKPAVCEDEMFDTEVRMWLVNRHAYSTRLNAQSGTVETLLTEVSSETDEKGPLDLRVKPALTVKLVLQESGKIKIEYSASAKVEYRVFGGSWQKLVKASVGGEITIIDGTCVTVVDEEYVTGKLCYDPAKSTVCFQGKAGYRGVGASFKTCVKL